MLNVSDIQKINDHHDTNGRDQFNMVLIDNNSWLKMASVDIREAEDSALYYYIEITEVNKVSTEVDIRHYHIGL